MCQPSIPEMPEYEEPKVAPAAPTPIQPDSMGTLPPPVSKSAGQGDQAPIQKPSAKDDLKNRTKGLSRFRIPLNTSGGSITPTGANQLNIPK